ncbi:MAG: hypothetical protein ACHQPH_10870 [Reyranellales bacterium]
MIALLAVATLPLFCDAASAADGKRPAAAAAVKPAPEPTGAELVGKMLSEQDGPSNPDVPLPQYGLSQNAQPNSTPLSGPRIYGRREDGGGVFGLKFPIGVHNGTN